jgi:hypothetical protein
MFWRRIPGHQLAGPVIEGTSHGDGASAGSGVASSLKKRISARPHLACYSQLVLTSTKAEGLGGSSPPPRAGLTTKSRIGVHDVTQDESTSRVTFR